MSFFSRLVFASTARKFSSTTVEALKTDKLRKVSYSMNRVELLGVVGGEPNFLISRNGDEFSTFRLYTNVNYRKRDGEVMEKSDAHEVSVFGQGQVNYVKQNVCKGSRVFVCGRVNYSERIAGDFKYQTARIGAETIIVAEPLKKKVDDMDDAVDVDDIHES